MAKYNLNMSVNHCPNWGFWEAIREILQNGDDQKKQNSDNDFEIVYNEKTQKLIMKNKESTLDRDTLLIGYSTKRENKDMIGKYGEGYKITLAVLSRLNKKIIIKNYKKKEKWTALVENGVVKVNIEKYILKSVPDSDLAWEVSNVSLDEWNSIQDLYLPFISDLDCIETKHGKLINNERLKGNIYIDNLFVQHVKDLDHSYSFPSSMVDLDRDRKAVNFFDLKYRTGLILSSIYDNESGVSKPNVYSLLSKGGLESEYLGMHLGENSKSKIANDFSIKNGENAFPVSDQEQYDLVQSQYKEIKPIFVTENMRKVFIDLPKYKNPSSLMDSLGLKIDLETNSPHDQLMSIYLKYKNIFALNIDAKTDILELLEKSKLWTENKE